MELVQVIQNSNYNNNNTSHFLSRRNYSLRSSNLQIIAMTARRLDDIFISLSKRGASPLQLY